MDSARLEYSSHAFFGLSVSASAPTILKRGSERILFIFSESGLNIPAEMLHYRMTKAGLQLAARHRTAATPSGPIEAVSPPIQFAGMQAQIEAAPDVGEHSRDILGELSYDEQAIETMLSTDGVDLTGNAFNCGEIVR